MRKQHILSVVFAIVSVFFVAPLVEANQLTIDGSSEERYANSLNTVMASLPEHQQKKFGQAVFIISNHRLKTSNRQNLGRFRSLLREGLDGKTGLEVIAEAKTIVEGIIKQAEERKAKITTYTIKDALATPIIGQSLACKGLLSTNITLAPKFPSDEDKFILGEESFIDEGYGKHDEKALLHEVEVYATSHESSDKLAIHLHERSITMMTKAFLEMGIPNGVEYTILVNNDTVIYAVSSERSLNSFLLNKGDGLAVWTKSVSRSRSFFHDPLNENKPIPSTYSTYLQCG